jgi:hypothetical protein
LLPNLDDAVLWPLLSSEDWNDLKEVVPFLGQFKDLTLHFSSTKQCRMSDCCLDFEDLLVDIKLNFIDKRDVHSDKLWYAANAAYTKLTKYYTKINSTSFAIATVIDPRYKLDVYDSTQDPIALKASATEAIERAFQTYSLMAGAAGTSPSPPMAAVSPPKKKQKRFVDSSVTDISELSIYLSEPRVTSKNDPLEYWRFNKVRFPILAKIARDYLALQPTSKDVEGTFSKGRRTIPYYRRSQNASTIRNQMLANSGYNLGIFE